jgi:hypothetical protein
VACGDKIEEFRVHKGLEGSRGIAKAESHDGWLVKAHGCLECGFPFIAFTESDIIISPMNIQLGKELRPKEFVD